MIRCLRTRVRKQPIIALYFESKNELEFYNLEALSMRFVDRMYKTHTNMLSYRDKQNTVTRCVQAIRTATRLEKLTACLKLP